jgi:hypothetical protein
VKIRDRAQRPEREDVLERQVLRVIQNHPDGIRTVDVGNELGVDWRALLGVIRRLLEDGAVERIDQQWYPAAKASSLQAGAAGTASRSSRKGGHAWRSVHHKTR